MENRLMNLKLQNDIEDHHLHLKEIQNFLSKRFLFPWFFFLRCYLYYMKILKDQGQRTKLSQSKQKLSKGSLEEWLEGSIWNKTETCIK